MLDVALKESAVICQALADGRQSLILQKIDTNSSWEFGAGPTRFLLWPVYAAGPAPAIKSEANDLQQKALAAKPPADIIRFTHFADVSGIYHVRDEMALLAISALHAWSDDAVRKMFHSGSTGVIVVPVRVHRLGKAVELPEKAGNVGYDQFTFLDRPIEIAGHNPVLTDDGFREILTKLEAVLRPTALA